MTPDSDTLESLLREGAKRLSSLETAQLDARVLLKHVLEYDDAGLIARGRDVLSGDIKSRYFDLLSRRAQHEPIAYITGVKEFWSLDFVVTPDVLIPRPDSECLIEAILARRPPKDDYTILDLGVGSGCLLCALLHELPAAHGVGVDRSAPAL
ncbi:MAG: N5-glutamine methyltransferase family protein, partial [Hyphococcus sp.]